MAARQGPVVSLAAIALHHKLNTNLLRRWVEQAEGNDCVLVARGALSVPSAGAYGDVVPKLIGNDPWPTARDQWSIKCKDASR